MSETQIISELEIVRGINNKDRQIHDRIFLWYYQPLCYFGHKIIQDPEEVKDIVVSSFCKLFEETKSFNDISHIKGFLYTVTKNECINYLRKNKLKLAFAHEAIEQYENNERNAELLADKGQIIAEIYKALDSLPPKRRAVFTMIHLDGLRRAEVASILGISENTVKNHQAKALEALRTSLGHRKLGIAILFLALTHMEN